MDANELTNAWCPPAFKQGYALFTVPYSGHKPMTRSLYEAILETRLGELISEDPQGAYNVLTSSAEYLPDLYEIATVWGGPKDWPAQIVACGQMQICLNQIDWSKGHMIVLEVNELPSLEAFTEAL